MNFYKLLALLFLTWSISSYTTEDLTSDIQQSDIIGHWDITVPTGMMFTEFSPDNRVLTGDRGTIAGQNASNHYFQDYALANSCEVADLALRSEMIDIEKIVNRMTIESINKTKGYRQEYSARNSSFENHLCYSFRRIDG